MQSYKKFLNCIQERVAKGLAGGVARGDYVAYG